MSLFALQVLLVTLSFSLSAAAQYRSGRSRAARLAGGAIAGIVIGSSVANEVPLQEALRTGGLGFGRPFGGGVGPATQEAGYAPGPGAQGGWNAGAQPAYGGPAGAAQPGGFAAPPGPPPAAYTRGY
ncbi:hypothetical protein GY45DRAFT_1335349 [Cubamyces sp. BRFM 1775]|nr:hypothetical protein GY45DRAFT_1335349 [Cubamyces sp. BRFM 1775]